MQGYYGSWLPFLLDPTTAALVLPLGSHRGNLSLRDAGSRLEMPKAAGEMFFNGIAGKRSSLNALGLAMVMAQPILNFVSILSM